LTIIAPRHPERGTAISEDLKARGLTVAQRSMSAVPGPSTDIYLADTIGELGLFYSLGTVVLLGGSLIPRGGQNPIEAIRLQAAIMSGTNTQNFADIYGALRKAGGVVDVATAGDIAETAFALLTDNDRRRKMKDNAKRAVEDMGGALNKTIAALLPLLPPAKAAESEAPAPPQTEPEQPDPLQDLRRAVS
jgi:3-deoxy-D-manno-octulosonic-acid transferase